MLVNLPNTAFSSALTSSGVGDLRSILDHRKSHRHLTLQLVGSTPTTATSAIAAMPWIASSISRVPRR
jgi:hypothetical protein